MQRQINCDGRKIIWNSVFFFARVRWSYAPENSLLKWTWMFQKVVSLDNNSSPLFHHCIQGLKTCCQRRHQRLLHSLIFYLYSWNSLEPRRRPSPSRPPSTRSKGLTPRRNRSESFLWRTLCYIPIIYSCQVCKRSILYRPQVSTKPWERAI